MHVSTFYLNSLNNRYIVEDSKSGGGPEDAHKNNSMPVDYAIPSPPGLGPPYTIPQYLSASGQRLNRTKLVLKYNRLAIFGFECVQNYRLPSGWDHQLGCGRVWQDLQP
jgi:hypothetical protein